MVGKAGNWLETAGTGPCPTEGTLYYYNCKAQYADGTVFTFSSIKKMQWLGLPQHKGAYVIAPVVVLLTSK